MQEFVLNILNEVSGESLEYVNGVMVVACSANKDTFYIQRVSVLSDYQGRGYFKLFLSYLQKYAARRGRKKIVVANIINPWLPNKLEDYGFELVGPNAILNLEKS